MSTVRVTVPPTFYDDHVDRELPAGVEVSRNRKGVTVDLTADELSELRSDAEHYAGGARNGFDEPWMLGLVTSARATVKRPAAVEVKEMDR